MPKVTHKKKPVKKKPLAELGKLHKEHQFTETVINEEQYNKIVEMLHYLRDKYSITPRMVRAAIHKYLESLPKN